MLNVSLMPVELEHIQGVNSQVFSYISFADLCEKQQQNTALHIV